MIRILFVCLGNICRSPSAEAMFRHRAAAAGLERELEIESAGTAGWHIGKPADPRAIAAAKSRGVTMDGSARQVEQSDFGRFDLIVAMDASNQADLLALPSAVPDRITTMRAFEGSPELDVPDPYYGGEDGFEEVLDILERCCDGLITEIEAGRLTPRTDPDFSA